MKILSKYHESKATKSKLIIHTLPYREIMEVTGRYSKSYDVSTKIGCMIDMAFKNEISWKMLESLLQ